MTPADRPWHTDPLEVDRFLDGELPSDLRAARQADLDRNPELALRVATRARFLSRLTASGPAWQATQRAAVPPGLAERVAAATARRTTARRPTAAWAGRRRVAPFAYAAAAVLLIGLGLFAFPERHAESEAMPIEVLAARDALEAETTGPTGGCRHDGPRSPFAFPPVKDGELDVLGCEVSDEASGQVRATLRGRAKTLGFVAVPDAGVRRGPEVGKTVLLDVVVYDILYGETRAFLAARKSFVDKRGDCAACHNRSREGQKNPHFITLRTWAPK